MIIKLNKLKYIYNPNTPFEKTALDNIDLQVDDGEFIGLIGHTGSGKSTLVQHLNGLIKPTSGEIIIDGANILDKATKLKEIRQQVGLVFQYPEHQLFEETIFKDIAFGPKNLGLKDEEVAERVRESMESVGLDYEKLKDRSPFELSGGQKRRVAIAGVLAMKPKILVLDEPTAGLDPRGRDEILGEIQALYKKEKITIILVSHSMEDIAKLVNRIVVMHRGRVQMDGRPREIFKHSDELESLGLGVPQITKLMNRLSKNNNFTKETILTVEEAKEELLEILRRKKNA